MTLREWTNSREMRAALGALVIGLAACGWGYTRATAPVVLPSPVPSDGIVPGALETPTKAPEVNVMTAVAVDLFAENRLAPAKRYRLPGEADPPLPIIPPVPRVIGTGYSATRGWFVVATINLGRPLYLYVGDPIDVYTVKSIERGKVTFLTPSTGKTLDVLVPNTGS